MQTTNNISKQFGQPVNLEKQINLAREKLIENLKNNGMEFLIDNMSKCENFSPLIKEWKKNVVSSDHQISFYAYQRARNLKLKKHKIELLRLLENKSYENQYQYIYYSLSFLCNNTKDIELFNTLMKKLDIEKDAYKKEMLLIGLENMDKCLPGLNLDPIIKLIEHRSKLLQITAIRALQKTCEKRIEDILLTLFQKTKKSSIKDVICTPLETVGTNKSIPILEQSYKRTRDIFLRSSIKRTIEIIHNRLQ